MSIKQITSLTIGSLNKKSLIVIGALVVSFGLSMATLTPAFAAKCGGQDTAILECGNSGGAGGGIGGILKLVIQILTVSIGIVAIGGLIYGAILWTTAGDNSGQITKSKTVIFNVVLGLVLYALMYSFLQFIIPGGVF